MILLFSISCMQQSDNLPSLSSYGYKLEGIIYSKDNPQVIIGGDIYNLNDTIEEYKIINILSDKVIIAFQGEKKEFRIGDTIIKIGNKRISDKSAGGKIHKANEGMATITSKTNNSEIKRNIGTPDIHYIAAKEFFDLAEERFHKSQHMQDEYMSIPKDNGRYYSVEFEAAANGFKMAGEYYEKARHEAQSSVTSTKLSVTENQEMRNIIKIAYERCYHINDYKRECERMKGVEEDRKAEDLRWEKEQKKSRERYKKRSYNENRGFNRQISFI